MIIFQDKLVTRTNCDEAVSNVLSPRALVFRPYLWTKIVNALSKSFLEASKWLSHLPGKPRVVGSIPGFSSPNETINQDPMTIFQDKLVTRTNCDEAVFNVLSPRALVLRPDFCATHSKSFQQN